MPRGSASTANRKATFIVPDLPSLPKTGWSVSKKGYVIYTSKRRDPPFPRGTKLHRAVLILLGATPEMIDERHIHHQDFNKQHNCCSNLILMDRALNEGLDTRRCPYTGQFLTRAQWHRRYGE